jgi:hypothetical protein
MRTLPVSLCFSRRTRLISLAILPSTGMYSLQFLRNVHRDTTGKPSSDRVRGPWGAKKVW